MRLRPPASALRLNCRKPPDDGRGKLGYIATAGPLNLYASEWRLSADQVGI